MVKLSVIIPTFNSAKTVSIALESILKQSFTDFEVLIMDGLSTDDTLAIVKSYKDNRIKQFSQKDSGIYDAMNKGIKQSNGEWLYFLGSDDKFYTPNVLQQVFNEISKTNCEVIYGDVYSTRFNGRYCGEFDYKKIREQNICHQSIFFKKNVFQKTGLFNLKYKSHADWDHNMYWLLNKNISKLYFDNIIAEYADGGFSSVNGDELFSSERILKYLVYGNKEIPYDMKVWLLKDELKRAKNSGQYWLFFKLCLYTPKILLNIKKRI